MIRVLVLIPCLDYPIRTIESIEAQTVRCDYLLATDKTNPSKTKGERVSIALNKVLATIDLRHYDWLLKIDSDTTIPKNFIEDNIKCNYDLMGTGRALLIKVGPFIKYCNGVFVPTVSDDEYIIYIFSSASNNIYKRRWFIPPDSIHIEPKIDFKTRYLIGVQNGRLIKLMNPRGIVAHPIYIIGWIMGLIFYPKLPRYLKPS
jgi:hypothetical protein